MTRDVDREETLLRQIIRGNRAAMKRFYDTYSGYLTAVCSRYVPDKEDVKDILQESFIKIFKAVDTFEYKGEGSLKAWASRIVVNEALKHIRTGSRLKVTNMPEGELPDLADDREPDFHEIPTPVIMEMIRKLPMGYRTVFNLYVFEEKSHKEIASLLNISESTSASQLHRAKGQLMQEIDSYRFKKMAL
ncbi:MAG: RNA polymerase sigma factor [Petrimonas mucosa]|jgi:RNA polymerase sigma-70 factor (ECF subfamily)|nr:RNA polymerase sigma-70 factor, ECF subfamily [Porphyromonadaceae bacterium KHP3R9]